MIRAGVIGIGNMGSNHCENFFPARCRGWACLCLRCKSGKNQVGEREVR
jgi:hypothetical protein